MANREFGTGKTVIVLAIVVACFAVLWPKILFPLFAGRTRNYGSKNLDGCCDVMFESDINAIKIMNDLCGSILSHQADLNPKLSQAYQQGKLSKETVNTCRTEVLNMCGIDIAEFLNKKEKIGHSYKQMLDEIRSFNISICLRHNFGVNPGLLGAPRRMRIWSPLTPKYLRQERPLHIGPEIIHPALREKGRAIPQGSEAPKSSAEKPGPVPGMRPPMGGAGHVVPPPKTGGGTMSVILPIYTVGIVLFFGYTILKIFTKKSKVDNEYDKYENYISDAEFRRAVFSEDYSNGCAAGIKEDKAQTKGKPCRTSSNDYTTRLGDIEIDQLKERLEQTEKAMARIVAQMEAVPKELLTKSQLNLGNSPPQVRNMPAACAVSATVNVLEKLPVLSVRKSNGPTGFRAHLQVMTAITGLLAEVDQQLDREGDTQNQYNTEIKGKKNLEEFCTEEVPVAKKASELLTQAEVKKKEVTNGHVGACQDLRGEPERDGKPKVKVVGLEMMAECEGGQKWSRPATPNLGVGGSSRSTTPIPPSYSPEPQNIFLEGALPQQSQLLVSDSKTQTLTAPDGDGPEPSVILSSKMTLSLISLDAALPEDNACHDQTLSQSHLDLKTECDDNLGTADSTLLEIDSELIDESMPNDHELLGTQEQEGVPTSPSQQFNELPKEKPSVDCVSATTNERAEAGLDLELEDTAADLSNLDGLDLNEEDVQICNGNSKEADELHEAEDPEREESRG